MMPFDTKPDYQRRWFIADSHQLAIDTGIWSDDIPALRDALLLDEYSDLLHVVANIHGAEHNWAPAVSCDTERLTHSIWRVDDPSRILALSVPDTAIPNLEQVSTELRGLVNIVAHRQTCDISMDIPELSDIEKTTLQKPGALLLLTDISIGEFSAQATAANHCFDITIAIGSPSFHIDGMRVGAQDAESSDGAEVLLVNKLLVDARELQKGISLPLPVAIKSGVRVQLMVRQATQPPNEMPASLVQIGQVLALRTESVDE